MYAVIITERTWGKKINRSYVIDTTKIPDGKTSEEIAPLIINERIKEIREVFGNPIEEMSFCYLPSMKKKNELLEKNIEAFLIMEYDFYEHQTRGMRKPTNDKGIQGIAIVHRGNEQVLFGKSHVWIEYIYVANAENPVAFKEWEIVTARIEE